MGGKTFGKFGGHLGTCLGDIWAPEEDINWGAEKNGLQMKRYSGVSCSFAGSFKGAKKSSNGQLNI